MALGDRANGILNLLGLSKDETDYFGNTNAMGTAPDFSQLSNISNDYYNRQVTAPAEMQVSNPNNPIMGYKEPTNTINTNQVQQLSNTVGDTMTMPDNGNVDLLSMADAGNAEQIPSVNGRPSFGSDQPVMPTKPTFTQADFDKVYSNQYGDIEQTKKDTGAFAKLKNLSNDKGFWYSMALGLNTMRLEPDQALATVLGKQLDKIQSGNTREKSYNIIKDMYAEEKDPAEKRRLFSIMMGVKQGVYDGDKALDQANKRKGGINIDMNGNKISPIFKKIDEEFAKDMPKLIGGGAADTLGQLQAIEEVIATLESGKEVTGALIGQLPDSALAFFNKTAVDTREKIEQTVQRSLRETLGAQFTEKEGERLIKRAYNPTLPEADNLRRVRRLYTTMMTAFRQRQAMAEYAQKNGTLQGYKGYQPTMRDMWSAVSGIQIGTEQEGMIYIGGDPSKQSSWKEK